MKLHLLEDGLSRFLEVSLADTSGAWGYPHALVDTFHLHWRTPDSANLADVFDECLQSRHTQRWWKRDQYRPKEIMLMLIAADPELAVIAWRDLANEAASLEGRIDRFGYYCQDILAALRKRDLRIADTHHHQDAGILSLYLAGMYPDKYALYPGLAAFQTFCRLVQSPNIPQVDDLPRYMKIAGIVHTRLRQDARYTQWEGLRRGGESPPPFRSFQTAFEAITWLGGKPVSDY